jgi:hypothetical protein
MRNQAWQCGSSQNCTLRTGDPIRLSGCDRRKGRRVEKVVAYPLCQYRMEDGRECGVLADPVHHIVELEDGGAPRDPANLLSLCRSHHSVIHAQRRRGKVA